METGESPRRITLDDLRRLKAAGRKFAMLTAYDFPTAAAAQAAGVHSLLIGDSMGTVLLGHPDTRSTPLGLMVILGEAVRRGAPHVYLVGDMPFEALRTGTDFAVHAAKRFCTRAGCDAVKVEVGSEQAPVVAAIARAGVQVIAHLGLRPQSVVSADGFKAQARDSQSICHLVADARRMVDAGAVMLLLEAVPGEASRAVVDAVSVPVIGCGAGPACDGHVVVTQDMLGWRTMKPPRFVPVLAEIGTTIEAAMRRYVRDIETGVYPAPQHVYPMRKEAAERPY
ncbi:MAG: 3-methyl-2-oxobutanoate hydroxymethyltransferase [Phycisphaerales bacterium]|nr:3-methyl-2-oxobutanoate hydroxymethyltransferase [Phycisphaerales bacterium]